MASPEEKQKQELISYAETPVPQRPYDENMVSKLERLAKLRQDGLWSEEEFTIAKRRVMGIE
jgi:hypothetical protein